MFDLVGWDGCGVRLPESVGWCEEDGRDSSGDDASSSLRMKGYVIYALRRTPPGRSPQLRLPNVASNHLASPNVEKTITRTNRHIWHHVRRPLSFSLRAFQSTMFRGIETWLHSHEPVYM